MRKLLLVVISGLILGGLGIAGSAQARLCDSCGFGDKKTHCFKCHKPFAKIPARICENCSFGNKKDLCVNCGKPFAKIAANLCDSCGFGDKKKHCVKCGKYMFN